MGVYSDCPAISSSPTLPAPQGDDRAARPYNPASMWALVQTTFRECWRRPLPIVLVVAVGVLGVISRVFAMFSFGDDEAAATHLVISSVFLAGIAHAAIVGAALIRKDYERGTMGLLLAQPLNRTRYLLGRFFGVSAAVTVLAVFVALVSAALLYLPIGPTVTPALTPLIAGVARALAMIVLLHAVALFSSAVASRVFAPILVLGVFVAGSVAGRQAYLPDFAVFGLEAGGSPAIGTLFLYTGLFALFFLSLGFLALSLRAPTRREG